MDTSRAFSLTCLACEEEFVVDSNDVLFNGGLETILYTVCPSCHVQTPLSTFEVASFLEG